MTRLLRESRRLSRLWARGLPDTDPRVRSAARACRAAYRETCTGLLGDAALSLVPCDRLRELWRELDAAEAQAKRPEGEVSP